MYVNVALFFTGGERSFLKRGWVGLGGYGMGCCCVKENSFKQKLHVGVNVFYLGRF